MPSNKPKPAVFRSKSSRIPGDPGMVDDLNQAQNLYKLGRAAEAETAYKRILKIDKSCVAALVALGTITRQLGDYAKARKFIERAIKYDTSNHHLRLELAKTHLARGDAARAEAVSKHALALEESFEVHCLRAEIFEQQENIDAAISAYRSALEIRKDVAAIHNNLGILYRHQRSLGKALQEFDRALEIAPHNSSARNNRGNTLKDLGDYDAAIAEYSRALDLSPKHTDTLYNLALCHQQNGRMELALQRLREIVEIAPDYDAARVQIVESLISLGQFADAEAILDEFLVEFPGSTHGWFLKASIHKYQSLDPNVFTPIIELLDTGRCDEEGSILLSFALGKLFDDIGDYEKAFSYYGSANTVRHRLNACNRKNSAASVRMLLETSGDDWRPIVDGDDPDAINPIFIVGMPRSGTTLVEQIIGAHSTITPAGEVDFFAAAIKRLALPHDPQADVDLRLLGRDACETLRADYLSRLASIVPGAATITDKTPANFYYLGLIQRLFPNARIVHCLRHPLDTCLSIYFQLFDAMEYAYDMSDIAAEYLRYEKIMAHWQNTLELDVLETKYEALVEHPETSSQALLSHCGLSWEQQCLTPNAVDRPINTMSRWQARQPIYRHSVQRWRHYEKHLAELKRKLEPVLGKYGYAVTDSSA